MIVESKSWPYLLKDSAADSKLKLLKEGETFGVEKPGGEKRLHIGSMNNEKDFDSYFFPNQSTNVLVEISKIDLIHYMLCAQNEYLHPIQRYRLPINEYYWDLLQNTASLEEETVFIRFEKNVDAKRYYLTRPQGDALSKNYSFISKISLPLVTIFNFIRIKLDDNSYKFYLKPIFDRKSISIENKDKDTPKNIEDSSSLHPYLTAIRTKPFLLLAGISGTGKSRIVRKLAQATNDIDFAADYDGEDRWKKHNPTNFCLIQVKPNWHNSMDVVGFKSNIGGAHYEFTPFIEFIAKAWHYPDTPFFLCLDEMNLAPVEEYFAEFLSAIESRSFNKDGEYETDPIVNPFDSFGPEVCGQMIAHLVDQKLDADCKLETQFRTKGLTLPKNLIVMGTVNMDETTFSFSRKVLDRAMSIEMNEVNYDAFLTGATEEDVPLLTDCNMLLVERPINAQVVKNDIKADKIIEYLKNVNELLEGTPFKLGYRAANEAFLYVSASKMFGSDDLASALDKFTVMKILSRIEGDDSKLKTKSGEELLPALLDLLNAQFGEDGKSISVQKLTEMNGILIRDHFVSFWG